MVDTRGTWWADAAAESRRTEHDRSTKHPTTTRRYDDADANAPLNPAHQLALTLAFTVAPASRRATNRSATGRSATGRSVADGPSTDRSATRGAPAFLSLVRANNVAIVLSRLPGDSAALARAAATGNADGALDADQIAALARVAPTDDEMLTIAARRSAGTLPESNALIPPERFLVAMSGVRRVGAKLDAAAFALRFDDAVEEVHAALDALKRACTQVRASTSLRAVLSAALAAGNALNAGTPRGGAAGFTLDSLHKLADVRSTIGGGGGGGGGGRGGGGGGAGRDENDDIDAFAAPRTLLDFVVAVADERSRVEDDGADPSSGPSSPTSPTSSKVASLATELEACESASRWTRAELASALARVELGAERVAAEAAAAAADAERDSATAGAVAAAADAEPSPSTAASQARLCASTFAAFARASEGRLHALRAEAAYVDAKYRALCAYVGESDGSDPSTSPNAAAPARGPEEIFGGLFAFARSVDAARERRAAAETTARDWKRRMDAEKRRRAAKYYDALD